MKKFINIFEIEILYILYGLFVFLEVVMFFLALACVRQFPYEKDLWGIAGGVLLAAFFIAVLEMEKLSLKNRIKDEREKKTIT